MSEELESCPLCGALPADQVNSDAVKQRVRNRYKFSRQGLLDDCAPMTALTTPPAGEDGERAMARRLIATYQFESQRADGEHAAEIVAVARALLSSRRMREALEKIAEPMGALQAWERGAERKRIAAEALASLSPQGG